MDFALLLFLVFMLYSVLLGLCLARMKSIVREIDTLKTLITTVGNVQKDVADSDRVVSDKLENEMLIKALKSLGADNA